MVGRRTTSGAQSIAHYEMHTFYVRHPAGAYDTRTRGDGSPSACTVVWDTLCMSLVVSPKGRVIHHACLARSRHCVCSLLKNGCSNWSGIPSMALVNLQLPGTPRTTLIGPPEVQLRRVVPRHYYPPGDSQRLLAVCCCGETHLSEVRPSYTTSQLLRTLRPYSPLSEDPVYDAQPML